MPRMGVPGLRCAVDGVLCGQALDVRLEFDEAGVLRENDDLVKV